MIKESSIIELKEKFGVTVLSGEIGFKFEDVFNVIDLYEKEKIPILGGDVYKKVKNKFLPAYDNWCIDKEIYMTDKEYLEKSILETRIYIQNYSKKENIVFVLVPN